MAESDNRTIDGVDNGWFGDCIIVSVLDNRKNKPLKKKSYAAKPLETSQT